MRVIILLAALSIAACSQAQDSHSQVKNIEHKSPSKARPSLSPSAPVNLTYQVEEAVAGQPQRIDIMINTRVHTGDLLVEVAKEEGVDVIDSSAQRIDLAKAGHPLALQLQAIQLGDGDHFFVLLLTIETGMGPMSRSFRIDLAPATAP